MVAGTYSTTTDEVLFAKSVSVCVADGDTCAVLTMSDVPDIGAVTVKVTVGYVVMSPPVPTPTLNAPVAALIGPAPDAAGHVAPTVAAQVHVAVAGSVSARVAPTASLGPRLMILTVYTALPVPECVARSAVLVTTKLTGSPVIRVNAESPTGKETPGKMNPPAPSETPSINWVSSVNIGAVDPASLSRSMTKKTRDAVVGRFGTTLFSNLSDTGPAAPFWRTRQVRSMRWKPGTTSPV